MSDSNQRDSLKTGESPPARSRRLGSIDVLVVALIAMLPWPAIATGICLIGSLFEEANECVLLFGGVTLIFLIPLGLFGTPEWVYPTLIVIVWLVALVVPPQIVLTKGWSKTILYVVFALQALFSAAQAGLGLLMVLGKYV